MVDDVVAALKSEAKRYCQLHKFKKSIKCLEKAIKLEPELAILWYTKGAVFGQMADELARQQMQMQMSGQTKEQHHHKAKRKFEEALECYDKAIELNPKDLKTWHNRGVVLVELGDYHTAIKCCDKAIELGQTSWESVDPNDYDGWDPKGIAAMMWMTKGAIWYIHLGRNRASFDSVYGMNPSHHDEAIKCFDKAIELNPKDANVWKHKGDALVDLAEHGFMKPYAKYGNKEQWKIFQAMEKQLFAQFNKYMEAVTCYEKVTELDPKDSTAWNVLGDTYDKSWLLNKDETLCDYLNHIRLWDEAEKVEQSAYEATRCYEKVTELDPKDSTAWTKLGIGQSLQTILGSESAGQAKAVEYLRKAVKLDPKNAIAWLIMGYLLSYQGNKAVSGKCFKKALGLDPSLTKADWHVGELYKLAEKHVEKNNERLLSEAFVRFHFFDEEKKNEYEKQRRERKLSDDLAKIEEICQNCSLTRHVIKTALDFYQSIDEDFEQVEWKSASLLGAPRSYEILKTRKSEMLKKPPFAAAIVYIACEMCDATHSIEEILQKICYPKKVKSKVIQDAKKYSDELLTEPTPAVLKIKQFESKEEYLDFMKELNAGYTKQVKKFPPELKKKS